MAYFSFFLLIKLLSLTCLLCSSLQFISFMELLSSVYLLFTRVWGSSHSYNFYPSLVVYIHTYIYTRGSKIPATSTSLILNNAVENISSLCNHFFFKSFWHGTFLHFIHKVQVSQAWFWAIVTCNTSQWKVITDEKLSKRPFFAYNWVFLKNPATCYINFADGF